MVWFWWCCNSVVLFLFLIFICLCLMNVIADCFVILFIVLLFVGCDPLGCFGFGWIRLLLLLVLYGLIVCCGGLVWLLFSLRVLLLYGCFIIWFGLMIDDGYLLVTCCFVCVYCADLYWLIGVVFGGIVVVLFGGLFDLPVLLFVALCLCCLFRLHVVCVWLMLRVYCVLLFDWFTLCSDVCVLIVFWLVFC